MTEIQKFLNLSIFLVISSFSFLTLGSSLPDHLDFRNYYSQYESLKRTSDSLRQDADDKYEELQTVRRKIRRLEDKKTSLENKLRDHRNSVIRLEKSNENLEIRMNTLRDDNKNKKQRIKNNQTKIPKTTAQIVVLKKQLRDLEKKKTNLSNRFQEAQSVVNKIESELKGVQSQAQNKKSTLSSLRQEKKNRNSKLSQDQKTLKVKKGNLKKLKDQRKSESDQAKKKKIQDQIKKTKSEIENLKKKIASTKKELVLIQGKIDTVKKEHASLEQKVASLKSQLSGPKKKAVELKNKLDVAQKKVQKTTNNIRSLRKDRSGFEEKIKKFQTQIRNNKRQINVQETQISKNKSDLDSLRRDIPRVKQNIDSVESKISTQKRNRNRIKESYLAQEERAQEAEAQTAQAYSKYEDVKRAYDLAVREAKQKGASDGRGEGTQQGLSQGKNDGDISGRNEGSLQGREDGLIYGYNQGLLVGESEGKEKGYQDGLNTSGKEAEGYSSGSIDGDRKALEDAQPFYKQARQDKRKELTSKKLKVIEKDYSQSLSDFISNETVSFENEDHSFQTSWEKSFEALSDYEGVNVNVGAQGIDSRGACRALSQRGGIHKTIPSSRDKCSFEYTEINDFCKQTYQEVFKDTFKKAYKQEYRDYKYAACLPVYEEQFKQHETLRYKEGYDKSYKESYAYWKKKGAQEIWQKGYDRGFEEIYNSKIREYEKQQYALGLHDEQKFFENNPVLILSGLSYKQLTEKIPGSVVAGDKFSVNTDLSNFGLQPTSRESVKIEFTPLTDNILVASDKKVVTLDSLEAETLSRIKNISTFQISKKALVGQTGKLKATVYSSGEKVAHQIVTIDISSFLQAEITRIYYFDRPGAGLTFRMNVTLKNKGSNIPEQAIKLKLSVPLEYQKYLRVSESEATISPSEFKPQDSRKVSFKLRTIKRYQDKIPMKLEISYFESVLIQKALYLESIN